MVSNIGRFQNVSGCYRIGFRGTQHDINPIISADIGADMVDISNIDV